MKIDKLVIYGFGKHENRTIELGQQMVLFYGPNETGKTTVQQFIIQILFGFPARNQTQLRYEPKNGGKHGGQLYLTDPHYGKLVIERIKGKSAGDVTITFEDGQRGGDAELKQVLRNYDRASFEAIFSFSVHELQGLDQLSETELSRTLLASGTTGIDALTHLESQLEKQMAELFKKSGRKPLVNALAEELREMEKELKDYRQRAELYSPSIERLQAIRLRLQAIEDEETAKDQDLKKITKWQQAAPLFANELKLTSQLERVEINQFPAEGRRQMDRLVDQLTQTKADVEYISNQLNRLNNPDQVDSMESIENLLNRESDWHQLNVQLVQKQNEALDLTEEREELLSLLGLTEQQAMAVDVSLSQEEQLAERLKELDLEEENQRFNQRSLQEEKNNLARAEQNLAKFLAQEPNEKERLAAEEWPIVSAQLAEAKAASKFQKGNTEQDRVVKFALMGVGLVVASYGFIQATVLLIIIGLASMVVGLWLFLKARKADELPDNYSEVLKKYGGKEQEYETIAKKVTEFDLQLDALMNNVEASKKNVASYVSINSSSQTETAYQQLLREIGLSPTVRRTMAMELFGKLRKVHASSTRLLRINGEIEKLKAQQKEWVDKAQQACGKEIATEGLIASLRSELSIRKEKQEHWHKVKNERSNLQEKYDQLLALQKQLEKEQQTLLTYAQAEEVFDFYRLADEWEKKQEVERALELTQEQLQSIGNVELRPNWEPEDAQLAIEQVQVELNQLKAERNELLKEQAGKQQLTQMLVSDTSYEEKLQQFEEKKASFVDLAKQWSVNKAIVEAINQTMNELKEKKLPTVLANAQFYFGKLTNGAYQELAMNDEGYFKAKRHGGSYFPIAELSQATKEQAYLALRLSLAVSMKKSHPFPIIMDDAFVHFDRSRLQQMINLVKELQKEHQFIYFTCHEDMQQAWPTAQIIHLANTERSVHS
ncbi:ATP-binding protein [Planococcus halocryophilus]|uniref:YhaN AAA domain-containing protein n=2 Tax=Planococcus halocryophilus TaxID=1215089 RepID=A0A1C7DM50_9BACL|nr:AAA family ATPase [Planococcus halocryophilus]ANU12474.1 hypothetical protein BBI08_00770 [Planococcus halocryophilus]